MYLHYVWLYLGVAFPDYATVLNHFLFLSIFEFRSLKLQKRAEVGSTRSILHWSAAVLVPRKGYLCSCAIITKRPYKFRWSQHWFSKISSFKKKQAFVRHQTYQSNAQSVDTGTRRMETLEMLEPSLYCIPYRPTPSPCPKRRYLSWVVEKAVTASQVKSHAKVTRRTVLHHMYLCSLVSCSSAFLGRYKQ